MSQRVSYSLLDPILTRPIKGLYRHLPIPRRFPPEGIVLIGHLLAITGAIGFAFSTRYWWAGLLAALGVAGNHLADCLDGTHARATGQCRNGGELLDHFLDPLSFAYWLVGIAVSCQHLELGMAALICLFATAILTNIKAKLLGEFTLAHIGPTEFKTALVGYGVTFSLLAQQLSFDICQTIASAILAGLVGFGGLQLVVQLVRSVAQVNRDGRPPDTSEWLAGSS